MESSLKSAADALQGTIDRLDATASSMSINTPLMMNAITPFQQNLETTFGREVCVHAPSDGHRLSVNILSAVVL